MKGDVTLLVDKKFDIILANINRNILLSDINKYYTCLNSNGLLFLSGFYKKDIELIESKCSDLGLQLIENIFESNWVALKFTKIDGN
jgi:ribosomal protein L11 methyltransferase